MMMMIMRFVSSLMYSKCWKAWWRSGCRIGRWSPLSIRCSTKCVHPISYSPVERILRSCTVPSMACYYYSHGFPYCPATGPVVGWQLDSLLVDSSLAGSIEFRRDVHDVSVGAHGTWPLL